MISYRALAHALHDADYMKKVPKNPTWAGLDKPYGKAVDEHGGGINHTSHLEPQYSADIIPFLQPGYDEHLADLGDDAWNDGDDNHTTEEEDDDMSEDPSTAVDKADLGPTSIHEPVSARMPSGSAEPSKEPEDDKKDDDKKDDDVKVEDSVALTVAKETNVSNGTPGSTSVTEPATARMSATPKVAQTPTKTDAKKSGNK